MEVNNTQVTVLTKITKIMKKLMALLVFHEGFRSRNGTFYRKESQMPFLFSFLFMLHAIERNAKSHVAVFFQVILRKFPRALRLRFCRKQPWEVFCKKRCS